MRGFKNRSEEIDYEDGGFDAGLLILSAVTPRGQERTHAEIAFVCGTNHQEIWHIERRAKEKIRAELLKRGIDINSI